MKHKITILILLFILSSVFLLYWRSFFGYFFQDDWFSFSISRVNSVTDFFTFFIPRTDVIYYRPLGMQIPFFVMRSMFALNAFPYHILIFLTHALNICLVYALLLKLYKKKFTAVICAFFYGTSAVHYIPFYWFATYAFILGPTFFFLTFLLFVKYLESKNKTLLFLYLVTYVLGILTNEIVVMYLPIQLIYSAINFKKYKLRLKSPLMGSTLITFFLVGLRFLFKPTTTGSYALSLGKHIFTNIYAYFLWSFNWPEEMKAQFINFYTVNPEFTKNFGVYYYIFFFTFILLVTFLFIIPLLYLFRMKRKTDLAAISLGILWFVLGLIPVLLFRGHSFAYYLPIPMIGLFMAASLLMQNVWAGNSKHTYWRNSYIFVIFASWFLSSFTTMEFNSKVHWAPRRSLLSKELTQNAQDLFNKGYYSNSIVYISPSSEKKLSLNNQEGLQVFFNNPEIQTVYGYWLDKKSL